MLSLIHTVLILIHGTWGADGQWYLPGGDFYSALEDNCSHAGTMVVPFRWSGRNTDAARHDAAHSLVRLLQSYPPSMRICLVGHSHGGNVALLASQLFADDPAMTKRIDAVYLLGTPASATSYQPDMNVINYLYNIISFEDIVQSVVGFFGREQPVHERIANLRIVVGGKEPDHTNLHHVIVGKWLLRLDQLLHMDRIDSFVHFKYQCPGTLYFFPDTEPQYEVDLQWRDRIRRDEALNKLMLNAISRTITKRKRCAFHTNYIPRKYFFSSKSM